MSPKVLCGVVRAAIGAVVALWASRFVASLLHGLTPRDPTAIAGAILALVTIAAIAGAVPARRASRIDAARSCAKLSSEKRRSVDRTSARHNATLAGWFPGKARRPAHQAQGRTRVMSQWRATSGAASRALLVHTGAV